MKLEELFRVIINILINTDEISFYHLTCDIDTETRAVSNGMSLEKVDNKVLRLTRLDENYNSDILMEEKYPVKNTILYKDVVLSEEKYNKKDLSIEEIHDILSRYALDIPFLDKLYSMIKSNMIDEKLDENSVNFIIHNMVNYCKDKKVLDRKYPNSSVSFKIKKTRKR